MDLATLQSWQPEQLAGIGDQLNTTRRALLDLQDEVDDGMPTSSWVGEAALGARESHRRRRDELNDLVAEIAPVITEVDAAAAALQRAKNDVDSGVQTIASHGWALSSSGGQVTATPPAGAEEDASVTSAIEGALTLITDALGSADQADANLAAVLQNANANQYDGGSGTLSSAGLPPHLRGLTDTELVDYLLEHPEEGAEYVDQLSTEQQQALGEQLATNAEALDYGDFQDNDFDREESAISNADLEALNAQLAAYGSNSTVATSALNHLGPETYLEIQQNLLMPQVSGDIPMPATVGEAQRQFGLLLAAGSNGTTAGASGDVDNVSAAWVDELITTAQATEYATDFGTNTVNGLQLLGVSAGNPGHGGYFLNELGTTIEEYEVAYAAENGAGETPWYQPALGGVDYRLDFTHLDSDDPRSWDQLIEAGYETGIPSGYDPMGGIFEGMSYNPEASREFLSGGFSGAENGSPSRIEYYLNSRDWDISPLEDEWVTAQRHFGDALVSATTVDPTTTSVDLAEQAVAAAAGTDLLPSLQRDFAAILGAYMPDVYEAYNGGLPITSGDADPFLPGVQDPALRASFSEQDLTALLQEVGEDDTALDMVIGSSSLYANYGYDAIYSGALDESNWNDLTPDTWSRRDDIAISSVNSPFADIVGATVEGHTDDIVEQQAILDQIASNQGDGYWEAGGWLLKKGAGFIPFVGSTVSDVIGWGVDGITGLNDVDNSAQAQAEAGQYIASTDGALQTTAHEAVYRNLPPEYLAEVAPELLGPDGQPVPMEQWTDEQANAWAQIYDRTGLAGSAQILSEDLSDQLTNSISRTEQQDGE